MDHKPPAFLAFAASLALTFLFISSCSLPVATPSPEALSTPMVGPSESENTPVPLAGPTNETPASEFPTQETAVSTFTVTSGTPSATCDLAEFVSDVTYPDGVDVNANEEIIKTWRVKNIGSCSWDSTYKLVFIRGEQMSGPSPADAITSPVSPNSNADLSLHLKAPAINGIHWGVWQFYNGAGKPVLKRDGTPQELSIQINVTNGQGGMVTSIRGWVYTFYGVKCSSGTQYDISTSIYTNGPVNVNYAWSTTNGQLTVVSQNYVFSNAGNLQVTTHLNPPFADPNNIRLTLTTNGSVQSSFTICP